jgi:hypothetical protein
VSIVFDRYGPLLPGTDIPAIDELDRLAMTRPGDVQQDTSGQNEDEIGGSIAGCGTTRAALDRSRAYRGAPEMKALG